MGTAVFGSAVVSSVVVGSAVVGSAVVSSVVVSSGVVSSVVVSSAVVSSVVVGSAVAGCVVAGSAAVSFSGAGSAVASSSGAGTDGATSTASRLLFSGLPWKFRFRPLWWLQKKLQILLVPATALSSRCFFSRFFCSTGGIQARTFIRRIHHNEDEHDTFQLQQTQLTTLHQSIQSAVFPHFLLSCPSDNCLPLAGACLCPLCHCGQVVSRTGLV